MNVPLKVEKGVPLPEGGVGRPSIYPFRRMEVGDSFLIKDRSLRKRFAVANATCQFNKRNPETKFCTRSTKDGIRVWRVK